MTRCLHALWAIALVALPLAAQDTSTVEREPAVPWRTSYFPYFTVSPNDGLMGIARLLLFRQAEYGDRVSLRDAVGFDAGYSTKNAWLLRARGDFPRIADGWRLTATAAAGKQPHFGDPSLDMARTRVGGWAEVTRRLHGPLALAVRGAVDHQRIEGNYELYFRYPRTVVAATGCPPEMFCTNVADQHINQTDVSGRAALVLDLRGREFETQQGALIEGGVFVGTGGGDQRYTGGYGIARGWYSPRRGTRLTARLAMQRVSETDAVGILQEIPAWESPVTVFGGPASHRGLGIGEVAGRGGYLASVELRHDLLNFGELGAITALVFVDGARAYRDRPNPLVDPAPGMRLPANALVETLDPWQVGGGGGLAIRVLRAAQLNITAARGAGVTHWYVSSGWSW
ncbi:MAG: hypothetical protein ABJC19_06730 [Gemmatimonadota bacterium]